MNMKLDRGMGQESDRLVARAHLLRLLSVEQFTTSRCVEFSGCAGRGLYSKQATEYKIIGLHLSTHVVSNLHLSLEHMQSRAERGHSMRRHEGSLRAYSEGAVNGNLGREVSTRRFRLR